MLQGTELTNVLTQLTHDPAPMVSELFTLTSNDWLVANLDVGLQPKVNCTDAELVEEFQHRVQLQNVMMVVGSNTLKDLVAIGNKLTEQISEKRPDFLPEKEKFIMEKISFSLSSGYDGIPAGTFKMVGPTLALGNDGWLINHVTLGLTLVPSKDVSDAEVFTAFKKENTLPCIIHITPQALARIQGDPLSDGFDAEDLTVVSENDFELNKGEDGFRCTVYPEGPSGHEVDIMDETDDVEWGIPVNRFYAFSYIEAIEPSVTVDKNDKYEEEVEDEVETVVEA